MIKASELARNLQNLLNNAIDSTELNSLIPDTKFEFYIATESADYKKPEIKDERNPNIVTVYINGIFRMLPGASSEGSSSADYVGTATANVDLLIPFADVTDECGTSIIADLVKDMLATTFQYNKTDKIEADEIEADEISYLTSCGFTMPYVGERAIRSSVGDSIPISFSVSYAFVAGGIPSEDIKFYVYTGWGSADINTDDDFWERIYPAKYGFARSSVQDGNVLSNDANGVSKCTTSATAFTITLDAAVRNTRLDYFMLNYIIHGWMEPIYVKVECGTRTPVKETYKMGFSQAGLNAEIPYAASTSITLVEVI